MKTMVQSARRLEGTIVVPGDKSISHRAAIFNALAKGDARVYNFSSGQDCDSTLRCLGQLGVSIEERSASSDKNDPRELLIHGGGPQALKEPKTILNAGNSGTTIRLMSGMLAGQPFYSQITGDRSLRSRPMGRIVEPLTRMGARIKGRKNNTLAPLSISGGNLQAIEHTLPVASAQVKSALLLAGLFAKGITIIHQPATSRDHTELMFRAMGINVESDGLTVSLTPKPLVPIDVEVPGDISSAAFWLVAAIIHPNSSIKIVGVGLNPTRTGILDALLAMGANIVVENVRASGGETIADLVAQSSHLSAIKVDGAMIPRLIDEIPILAVAALFARGTTEVRDAAELRLKESDRIKTTAQELRRLGGQIDELADGMRIYGGGGLYGNSCHSHGDHRLAMTLAIAGLVAKGQTTVESAQVASVSYPSFWKTLQHISGQGKAFGTKTQT
jgi:3-phosphoshikimate 1-carboxyvinyltransferase